MRLRAIYPAILALVLGATGCVTDQGRFTVMSTRDVEISRVDLKHTPLVRNVRESDGRFWFLFIPFGRAPSVNAAVDGCLRDGKGDFLVNADVHSTFWTLLLFSWESYSVQGDIGNSLGAGTREVLPDAGPGSTIVVPAQDDGAPHN